MKKKQQEELKELHSHVYFLLTQLEERIKGHNLNEMTTIYHVKFS